MDCNCYKDYDYEEKEEQEEEQEERRQGGREEKKVYDAKEEEYTEKKRNRMRREKDGQGKMGGEGVVYKAMPRGKEEELKSKEEREVSKREEWKQGQET